MESILLAIDPRDPLWIAIAFLCGLFVKLIGLPPLIGFLIAGFLLNFLGAEGGEFLQVTADLGVTLLLFTIGLKLRLSSLAQAEVWGVATLHLIVVTALLGGVVLLLATAGLPLFSEIDMVTALLIGFALSFSSTVFAIKILEALGATTSRHGQVSIGVLIVQDLAAVAFLAVASGKVPSIWAFALLGLIPLRHVLYRLLSGTGHGELLVLFGIVLAVGGADLFELVGMKGDLGALALGVLMAGHPKSGELAKALLGFKEIFLVGFFLSIGLASIPGWTEVLAATLLLLVLPVKVALYFGLFAAFRLRARNAWQSSLNLANYSEFGLIVGSVAVSAGWLGNEWLAVFAILLSMSFIVAAPVSTAGDRLYNRFRNSIRGFEHRQRLPDEQDFEIEGVAVLIFGMGRIGTSVYDVVCQDYPGRVLGVDSDAERVDRHLASNRQVVAGDATNPDFWSRAQGLTHRLDWVLLTMPSHQANMAAAERLREIGFSGRVAATTRFPDEATELQAHGVEFAFDIYAEAGHGFANDLRQLYSTG